MRSSAFLVAFLAAGAARADRPAALDARTLPASCQWAAAVPREAPASLTYAAMTSAANCAAIAQLRGAPRDPSQAGARTLAERLAPSMRLLDDVIAHGDPKSQILAAYSKADLLSGMRTFLVEAVPPPGADLAAYKLGLDAATAVAQPWNDAAAIEFDRVRQLSETPEGAALAARDPSVAFAVRDPRTSSAAVISRR